MVKFVNASNYHTGMCPRSEDWCKHPITLIMLLLRCIFFLFWFSTSHNTQHHIDIIYTKIASKKEAQRPYQMFKTKKARLNVLLYRQHIMEFYRVMFGIHTTHTAFEEDAGCGYTFLVRVNVWKRKWVRVGIEEWVERCGNIYFRINGGDLFYV